MRVTLPLLFAASAAAFPFPRDETPNDAAELDTVPQDELHDAPLELELERRQCAIPCGWNNAYCCSAGQTCYTSGTVAGCANTAAGGGLNYYTTTWTVTQTYTSTYSSYYAAATTATAGAPECTPPAGSGQIACGGICCASWQYCAAVGQCSANGGSGTWVVGTTVGVVTTQFSAPYRVTGTGTSGAATTDTASTTGTAVGVTTTGSGTATPQAVSTTGGSSLSGGAIAGIVIGSLAGVAILILLCVCCVIRETWHGLLALFGLRNKRERERVEVTEERYSRHGSVRPGSARPAHRNWFGRPSAAGDRREKKSGGGMGWLITAGVALLILLGLRRDNKRKNSNKPERSDYGSTYYYSDYTVSSRSSPSSGRTRDTRRSRTSRAQTRASRRSSRR